MYRKKGMILMMAALTVTAGCASNASNTETNNENANANNHDGQALATDEILDLEVWWTNVGFKGIEKGSPLYNFYKDQFGVGVISPYVEWNGGTDYLNQLNMKIAAGEMPNVFLPWNNESELAKNGAIADLTDLLPQHAPNLWKLIPEDVWNVVKANDPTGQGRIYWVPGVNQYEKTTGLIRKDWLDNVGLQMPRTQEDYINVLKAFKEKDPNGNGQADEIPTGGRENARWMDHLFNMYGIAMAEGYPDWDLYNGELTFSAVSQNMKDALAFASSLYKEKLLDQETFLNDKAAWDAKIDKNIVGNYYHWGQSTWQHLQPIQMAAGIKAEFSVLPVIEAPGYEGKGFITTKKVGKPAWVVSAMQDEAHLIASLKLLNELADESQWMDLFWGVEGMHHTNVNGKKELLPEDKATQQNRLNPYENWATVEFIEKLLLETASETDKWSFEQSVRNMKESQQYVKAVAGDGLPASIYDDYPDIKNNTLWFEYATKIIIGTYSIDKFDEFVEKWHQSGGDQVTQKAREWYATVGK